MSKRNYPCGGSRETITELRPKKQKLTLPGFDLLQGSELKYSTLTSVTVEVEVEPPLVVMVVVVVVVSFTRRPDKVTHDDATDGTKKLLEKQVIAKLQIRFKNKTFSTISWLKRKQNFDIQTQK